MEEGAEPAVNAERDNSLSFDYSLYTSTQQDVLGYTSVGAASLSVIGTLIMMVGMISDHRKGNRMNPFHHLLLGLTFCNFCYSLGLCALGPWAIPKEARYYVNGAKGSFSTCNASGFLLCGLLGAAWYWFAIAIYYVMIVTIGWSPSQFGQYLEPFGHMMAVLAFLLKGGVSIYYEYFVPLYTLPGICFIGLYPPECASSDDDVECTRGEPEEFYYSSLLWRYGIPFIFCGIILATILIMVKIQSLDATRMRTRDVGTQGLCYLAVFFAVFTPAMAVALADPFPDSTNENQKAYFAIALITKILTPLGGFFNMLVFIRRRFKPLQYATPGR